MSVTVLLLGSTVIIEFIFASVWSLINIFSSSTNIDGIHTVHYIQFILALVGIQYIYHRWKCSGKLTSLWHIFGIRPFGPIQKSTTWHHCLGSQQKFSKLNEFFYPCSRTVIFTCPPFCCTFCLLFVRSVVRSVCLFIRSVVRSVCLFIRSVVRFVCCSFCLLFVLPAVHYVGCSCCSFCLLFDRSVVRFV